jgi:hypothetical protein
MDKTMHRLAVFSAALVFPVAAGAAISRPQDADPRAWWKQVGHLSSDAMEVWDIGSDGHARAVKSVSRAIEGRRPEADGGQARLDPGSIALKWSRHRPAPPPGHP